MLCDPFPGGGSLGFHDLGATFRPFCVTSESTAVGLSLVYWGSECLVGGLSIFAAAEETQRIF